MAFRQTILVAALLLAIPTIADAKPKHRVLNAAVITCDERGCSDRAASSARYAAAENSSEGVIGGRPAGCPRRFCGCGVSLKVFGRIIPELNLAANWKHRFPRAHPGPGMVAARSGHVFYIVSMIDAETAMAYDPNSGGGKIRIHPRPLRGYTVVDPNGRRLASND